MDALSGVFLNKKFQRELGDLEWRKIGDNKYGIFAKRDFKEDEILMTTSVVSSYEFIPRQGDSFMEEMEMHAHRLFPLTQNYANRDDVPPVTSVRSIYKVCRGKDCLVVLYGLCNAARARKLPVHWYRNILANDPLQTMNMTTQGAWEVKRSKAFLWLHSQFPEYSEDDLMLMYHAIVVDHLSYKFSFDGPSKLIFSVPLARIRKTCGWENVVKSVTAEQCTLRALGPIAKGEELRSSYGCIEMMSCKCGVCKKATPRPSFPKMDNKFFAPFLKAASGSTPDKLREELISQLILLNNETKNLSRTLRIYLSALYIPLYVTTLMSIMDSTCREIVVEVVKDIAHWAALSLSITSYEYLCNCLFSCVQMTVEAQGEWTKILREYAVLD